MELMYLEKKLINSGHEHLGHLLKKIRMFDELIMEDRIKILTLSLIKLGLTESAARELINDFALEQLEEKGSTNYKELEESCFSYVYDNIYKNNEGDTEYQEKQEYADDKVYQLNKKERYEEIFIEAFDSLDYGSQGVIIETTLRPEEENIYSDYVNAVNQLISTISETDEDLGQLVEKKMLKEKNKSKIKL